MRIALARTGWRDDTLVTAIAVAIGESGHYDRKTKTWSVRPEVVNDNPKSGDYSVGVFQINYIGKLRAERVKRFGPPESQKDPEHNVSTAWRIYQDAGNTFRPWGAFTNGSYKQYLSVARAAADENQETTAVPTYDRPSGYTTVIPAGVNAIRYGIGQWFGLTRTEVVRDLSRCQQKSSEHCVCRGIDEFTTDNAVGRPIFDFCIWAADRLGIQSVIWRDREWGFGNWTERHRSLRDHFDHVHIGVNKWGAANVTRAMVDAALDEYFNKEKDDMPDDKVLREIRKALYIKADGKEQEHLNLIDRKLDQILELLLDEREGYDKPLNRLAVIEADTKLIRQQHGDG